MSTIIILGTAHSESGACTSEELYKIIQEINPEVIFCEASPEKFPQYLKRNDVITPEIQAIKRLIKEKSIEIVPIDVNKDPFDNRLEAMFALIKREMQEYLGASHKLSSETHLKGFAFLSSQECDIIFRDKDSMEKYFIKANKVKYKGLSNFYIQWLRWNDIREIQWINLIDRYFKKNKPERAVFLVGAGHRFRLMDKIANIENNNFDFNWNFFPFN